MNIAGIHKESIVDGAGIRLSVFVSGCTRRCPGCFNKEAWDFDYGTPIDGVMAEDIIITIIMLIIISINVSSTLH